MNAAIDVRVWGSASLTARSKRRQAGWAFVEAEWPTKTASGLKTSQLLDNLCIGQTIACRIDEIDLKTMVQQRAGKHQKPQRRLIAEGPIQITSTAGCAWTRAIRMCYSTSKATDRNCCCVSRTYHALASSKEVQRNWYPESRRRFGSTRVLASSNSPAISPSRQTQQEGRHSYDRWAR